MFENWSSVVHPQPGGQRSRASLSLRVQSGDALSEGARTALGTRGQSGTVLFSHIPNSEFPDTPGPFLKWELAGGDGLETHSFMGQVYVGPHQTLSRPVRVKQQTKHRSSPAPVGMCRQSDTGDSSLSQGAHADWTSKRPLPKRGHWGKKEDLCKVWRRVPQVEGRANVPGSCLPDQKKVCCCRKCVLGV